MSILGQVLLTLLALSACQVDMVPPWAHARRNNMLKENIILLDRLLQMEVSCNKMNVTNIFADDKRGNNSEIFCKAATITLQGHSCHTDFKGIYDNLLSLVKDQYKGPCPVAAGSTTSLKNFLKELHQVLKEEYKSWK